MMIKRFIKSVIEFLKVISHAIIEIIKIPRAFRHEILLIMDWFRIKFSREFYIKEFRRSQEIIASTSPKLYRLDRYEQLLWYGNIPAWIYDLQYESDKQVKNCLDIGCGYGTMLLFCKRLFNCHTLGTCLDTEGDYLNTKQLLDLFESNEIHVKTHDIEIDRGNDLGGLFDIILFTEVMEHLNFNPVYTLRKLGELLSPDGKLYISTPDSSSRWGKITDFYKTWEEMPEPSADISRITADGLNHIYHYSEQEIRNIIEESGLQISRYSFAPGGINGRHHNLEIVRK